MLSSRAVWTDAKRCASASDSGRDSSTTSDATAPTSDSLCWNVVAVLGMHGRWRCRGHVWRGDAVADLDDDNGRCEQWRALSAIS